MSIDSEIKAGMRKLLAEKGQKLEWYHRWTDADEDVSPFGWVDYGAREHIDDGCHWVVPEGVVVNEVSYSMFDGTFTGNKDEVGLNAGGCRCACGKYKDVTLRLTSSLGEAIQGLMGYDPTARLEL